MSDVDLSIIIVNWNVAGFLVACLESIYSATIDSQALKDISMQVIVVDSASTDSSVEIVKNQFPQVELHVQTENVGFTRGNNIGFRYAKGRHILLLNPDTVVLGNALAEMVNYLDENGDVGVVGPYTLNPDGTLQSSRRRFPTPLMAYFESTWLQPYAPQRLMDQFYVNDLPQHATVDVDWVQGSAMMVRREVYDQIGGFDEGYVMYSEELDWCKRAKVVGWRVVFLCTAQIIHHGGQSTGQIPAKKHIYFQESKLRYFGKFHGERVAGYLRLFLLMNYHWQIVIESVKSLLGHKRTMRRERIRQYREVIRSGLKVT